MHSRHQNPPTLRLTSGVQVLDLPDDGILAEVFQRLARRFDIDVLCRDFYVARNSTEEGRHATGTDEAGNADGDEVHEQQGVGRANGGSRRRALLQSGRGRDQQYVGDWRYSRDQRRHRLSGNTVAAAPSAWCDGLSDS